MIVMSRAIDGIPVTWMVVRHVNIVEEKDADA
jgi:hypothetical protein